MPSPTSPSCLITSGDSSPGAIGRSASLRSPSVRSRKSTSMLSFFATTVTPSVRSASTHLMLRASAVLGIALQQRLDVGVDPCERGFGQARRDPR